MNNFDDWSQIISKYLHSQADPLNSLTKLELEDNAARTAFIHAVLDRFLPEIYGVGTGQIMDSGGRLSNKMDIIIYRRDFPRLDLPGCRDIYIYESVIATIEVVGKMVKRNFFDALDRCASIGNLEPDIDRKVMTGLAARNQLTMNEKRQYIHPDPIRTARFHLIGRPVSFIYAFSGYKTSPKQLADTMQSWMDAKKQNDNPTEMKDLPAVVATHGCFAWRNSAPFTVNEHSLMGIGADSAPIRLVVLQLLHVLSRRLKVTTDGYGLKPGLDAYLNRMPRPKVEIYIGKANNPAISSDGVVEKSSAQEKVTATETKKPVTKAVPKSNQTAKVSQINSVGTATKQQVKKTQPASVKKASVPQKISVAKAVKDVATKPEIKIRKRPSIPPVVKRVGGRKAVSKTLSSLNPKPAAVDAPFPVPNADMVPRLNPNPPGSDAEDEKATANNRSSRMVAAIDSAGNKFMDTVKLSMQEQQKKPASSAEDFLETVKTNIASPEPIPHLQPESEPEPEPFTSTIPQ